MNRYELADNTVDRDFASESWRLCTSTCTQYTQGANSAPLLNANVKPHFLSRLESQSQESGLTRRLADNVLKPKALEPFACGAWHQRIGSSSSVFTRAAHADAGRFWRQLAIRSTHTSIYYSYLQFLHLRSRFARPSQRPTASR